MSKISDYLISNHKRMMLTCVAGNLVLGIAIQSLPVKAIGGAVMQALMFTSLF